MDPSQTIALNRLLIRLTNNLSTDSASLPQSQYERNKVGANIEHARTMLLTLEKQAGGIRVQNERQRAQADLLEKREAVKRLGGRLEELNKAGDIEDNDDEANSTDDSEPDEQPEPSYAPARPDAQDGLETGGGENPGIQLPEALHNHLRARATAAPQASDNRDAATTTARETLFANRSPQTPPTDSNLSQNETLLSHNRAEQENLTTGLLGLARALKESSLQFSSSLEGEKDVLKRAEGGLDKSALGMEAAERKMGALRRMSEGQGWFGRLKLYGMIGALWVVAFLLVFVGPKIRL